MITTVNGTPPGPGGPPDPDPEPVPIGPQPLNPKTR
jgi:hypothetical protein